MAVTHTKEKRRHPRFPVGISMAMFTRGKNVGRCKGEILDLSVGGMAFKTGTELEEGSSLFLKINIPLEIRGEVRHIKAGTGGLHRYGVRFHKIGFSSADAARPANFIAAKFQK
jgi:hypothetical protein